MLVVNIRVTEIQVSNSVYFLHSLKYIYMCKWWLDPILSHAAINMHASGCLACSNHKIFSCYSLSMLMNFSPITFSQSKKLANPSSHFIPLSNFYRYFTYSKSSGHKSQVNIGNWRNVLHGNAHKSAIRL